MKDHIKTLISTTFYFDYYDYPFKKGEPYFYPEMDPGDDSYHRIIGYNENRKHFDFSVRIDDFPVKNASIKENFALLHIYINQKYSQILNALQSDDFTPPNDFSDLVLLLENFLNNYYTYEVDGHWAKDTLVSHNFLQIIPNDLKKYDKNNSYYEYVLSEFFAHQKQMVGKILFEIRSYNVYTKMKTTTVQHLNWKGSDTDLLELIVALLEKDSLRDNNDKKMTRKDAIKLFEGIFQMEIKDPESKLSRVSARNTGSLHYLDHLKAAYDDYLKRKEEKFR